MGNNGATSVSAAAAAPVATLTVNTGFDFGMNSTFTTATVQNNDPFGAAPATNIQKTGKKFIAFFL